MEDSMDESEDAIKAYNQSWYHTKEMPSRQSEEPERHWWIVDEDAGWRVTWDILSVGLTCFVLLLEPWIAAFDPRGVGRMWNKDSKDWVIVLDVIVFYWFAFDMALSFVTTYRTYHGMKVVQPRAIAVHYLKGFFLWDAVCTIPWEHFLAWALCGDGCPESGGRIAVYNMIPILRAWRGSKISKAHELSYRFSIDFSDLIGAPPAADHIVRFTLGAFFGMHMVACIWFILGDRPADNKLTRECYEGLDFERRGKFSKCTWYQRGGYSESQMSNGFLYVTCLYWAVTTVTTVGYGDITPATATEKVFTMAVQICGIAWFASLVSALSTDVIEDTKYEESRQLKLSLKKFLYKHRFPSHLALAVNSYVRHQFEVEREFDGEDPEVSRLLRDNLNDTLKRHVALHMASRDPCITRNFLFAGRPKDDDLDESEEDSTDRQLVDPASTTVDENPVRHHHDPHHLKSHRPFMSGRTVSFFSTGPIETTFAWGRKHFFVADCVLKMKALSGAPHEVVVPVGEKASALYVIGRGRVETKETDDFAVEAGDYFGDEGLLINAKWAQTLYTPRMYCEFNIIYENDLAVIFGDHPEVAADLRSETLMRHRLYPSIFILDETTAATTPSSTSLTNDQDDDHQPAAECTHRRDHKANDNNSSKHDDLRSLAEDLRTRVESLLSTLDEKTDQSETKASSC